MRHLRQRHLTVTDFHERSSGDCSIEEARQCRENGEYEVPLVLYTDAMSMFAAVTASFVKIPADNGMLAHVQYFRVPTAL